MHGYVEMMERLAFHMNRDPTDEEIRAALADQMAARIDAARDRAKEFADEQCAPEPDELIENYEDRRGS